MKTRCLLVDDEPLAIQLLQNHMAQLESFEIVATAQNAVKALEILKSTKIDLLFCDIKMPILSGIDLIKTLKNPPKTIITTAHREFALEGYELDIVDYLLKPITFERFLKAIEKYLRSSDNKLPVFENPSSPSIITIKSNAIFHKINTKDILYLESQKDYVKFILKDREIISKYKISEIESLLNSIKFLRIHRSFIVNEEQINSYTATHVDIGKNKIPIGMSYKELVLAALKND